MKFNDTLLYSWKSKFEFTTSEKALLFNNDIIISEEERDYVFNYKSTEAL
jgi:hypothetical protein